MGTDQAYANVRQTEVEEYLVVVRQKPEIRKVVETAAITDATEKPLEEALKEADSEVLSQTSDLLFGNVGTSRGVETVDKNGRCCPTWICECVVDDHNLSKRDKSQKSNKTNCEQKGNHPSERRILHILCTISRVVQTKNLVRLLVHGKKI